MPPLLLESVHRFPSEEERRRSGEEQVSVVISAQDSVGVRNKGRNELISYLVSGVLMRADLQWLQLL